ncbi:MAG TPA: hypothetical protein VFX24_03240 [Ktedonobacterales bacterium]|nr:hypothetical protein [Ktedonobacterales bacterium]
MDVDIDRLELVACTPQPIRRGAFNPNVLLPFGCATDHLFSAMDDFINFLGFVNSQLHTRQMPRLESLLMPANFSSVVSEYMNVTIPKYCSSLARNTYHNGHPDLLPAGLFPNNSVQYSHEGIEIKASRYLKNWQGHNAEESWLMVFVFDSNRPNDHTQPKLIHPKPFRFIKVVGAQLEKSGWKEQPRGDTSRRTATATILPSGYDKMEANWIYRDADIDEKESEMPDEETTLH